MADRDDREGRRDICVAASNLAEIGFCEYRVLLAKRLGQRCTARQIAHKDHGAASHDSFHADARHIIEKGGFASQGADNRCFIATAVYGPHAPETIVLRRFRDAVLAPSALGRQVICTYYRFSPSIAAWLRRSAVAAAVFRFCLNAVVPIARFLSRRTTP